MFRRTPKDLRSRATQYRLRADELDRNGKHVQARTWRTKAERMEARAAERETTKAPH